MKPTWQYSLRTMICFIVVGTFMLALNLLPAVTKSERFTTLYDPAGSFGPMHDTISLDRGFPLRYQQSEEWFGHNTVTDLTVDTWQQDVGMRVTHIHWLLINALFTAGVGTIAAYAFAYPWRKKLNPDSVAQRDIQTDLETTPTNAG